MLSNERCLLSPLCRSHSAAIDENTHTAAYVLFSLLLVSGMWQAIKLAKEKNFWTLSIHGQLACGNIPLEVHA